MIPDDLLIARDEGRVVFFCGAGISRARASLPDFFGLAEAVIHKLVVSPDNHVCRILKEARELDERTGVSGLISADRIFGLLERDFHMRDIEVAVAEALRPAEDVDLSAHRVLLDLATTREGKVRLVTTNFDRLFEACRDTLNVWQPPYLPDPSRQDEIDGIIHLHGCVTKDYTRAEGDGFVLTSSEFGRAYLSEGWATQFFREILDRYIVVFVGYTADDPPVRYLLEALNKKARRIHGVYAFQSGSADEAAAKWFHKGIEAISYEESDGHWVLWETLREWSGRAKSPDEWYTAVIELAKNGPGKLQPHERGKVAHIISTVEGARKFAEGDDPPPAEWLCVFDPYQRYAKPGHAGEFGERGPFVDPFDLYGLDSDEVPKKIDPNAYHEKRDIPPTAWDGLATNRLDRQNLRDDSFPAIRGEWAVNVPGLPPRLFAIGAWITRVSDQPAAIWWAAGQSGLHPAIRKQLQWQLEHAKKDAEPVIRQAWRYLFEVFAENRRDSYNDWYYLKAEIDKDGWRSSTIRKLAMIRRPYLTVERNFWGGPVPPQPTQDISIRDILSLDVQYPEPVDDMHIPDEWLEMTVREFRKNLEYAVHLETELGGYALNMTAPIIPDNVAGDNIYERTHGLSGSVISVSQLFARLVNFDISAAKKEFDAWRAIDSTIFSLLIIWVAGERELVSAEMFGAIVNELSDDAFWSSHNQRDLLLVLAERWRDLPERTRKDIENRLIRGRNKWEGEDDIEYKEHKAWISLNRLYWLTSKGCEFTFDLDDEACKLQRLAPKWKPEYAAKSAEALVSRGGFVKTRTDYSALINEPLDRMLPKAVELSGIADDFLVKNDPFAGLSAERPVLAFSALNNAAKRNEYPEWAWRTFLNAEARRSDKPKFSALIAERLSRYPNEAVTGILRPASNWLLDASQNLSSSFPQAFDKIIVKLINVLQLQPLSGSSAIIRGDKEPDWPMEAINAPAGKIAQALFRHPKNNSLSAGGGVSPEWLTFVDDLLSLSGDLRRHALTIFSYNMNWFYSVASDWTEVNILAVLDRGDEQDRDAILSGFFWHAMVPNQKLYMRLKANLLIVAKQNTTRRKYREVLAGIILAGWGTICDETKERCISNAEMHDILLNTDDEFRSRTLWQIERWAESGEDGENKMWSVMLPKFLRDVWPRQKSVKTAKMSGRLCDLAFSNVERFPEISEIILPLLTAIDSEHLRLPHLRKTKDSIIDLYPERTLALMHAVLPDNIAFWPYDIEDVLRRIGEADARLSSDERLIELNRKWRSR